MTKKVIKVPDIPGPTVQLCWKVAPYMVYCDRRKGHEGMHSWELYDEVKKLKDEVDDAWDNYDSICDTLGSLSRD